MIRCGGQEPIPDPRGGGGPGTGKNGGGGGDSGGDDQDKKPCEGEGEEQPEHPANVQLSTGHKIEHATDIVVPLVGRDFRLTRSYSSQTDLNSPGLVGENWTMSSMRYIAVSEPSAGVYHVIQDGGSSATHFVYTPVGVANRWTTGGSTSQYFTRVSNALTLPNGTPVDAWRLIEPGSWQCDFYDPLDPDVLAFGYAGLLAQEQDIYGNVWRYLYQLHGTGTPGTPRLHTINLNSPTPTKVTAAIYFFWNLDDTLPSAIRGKLASVAAYQQNAAQELVKTQEVLFTYKVDADGTTPDDGNSADVGRAGDLIMTVHRTSVDMSPLDAPLFRERITQYRYYRDGVAPPGPGYGYLADRNAMRGGDHQLKMVINPEQIEFMAQRLQNTSGVTPKPKGSAVVDWAVELLKKADWTGPSPIWYENGAYIHPVDMAAKVVGYDTTTHQVNRQYLQAGCGCSGATQGLRLDYTYSSQWTRNQEGVSVNGFSTRIVENAFNGDGYSVHRTLYYDMVLKGSGSIPYLDTKAIAEPSSPNRTWVTRKVYSANSASNLIREFTPSSIAAYSPCDFASPATAPSVTTQISSGLVYEYGYTLDNRRASTAVRNGDSGLQSLLSVTTYNSTRSWLPDQVDRYRVEGITTLPASTNAADLETTTFTYGFHTGDMIQWVKSEVEAEAVAENGPGGTYATVSVYDQFGRNIWRCAADNALTKFEYSDLTGAVVKVTQNSDATDLPSLNGLSTAGWGQNSNGGALTTEYRYDAMGRLIERKGSGGVRSYTVRRLREIYDRPGIYYYAEVDLPHDLGVVNGEHSFNGPVTITSYTAGGKTIASSDYQLSPTAAYNPSELDFTILSLNTRYGDLALTVNTHLLSGLLAKQTRIHYNYMDGSLWAQLSYETTYEYDAMGRVTAVIDPNMTVTEYPEYDVLNRPLSVKIGRRGYSGGDAKTVAEYFYDADPAATTPVQGTGNSNLTITLVHADEVSGVITKRRFNRYFDFRDRPLATQGPTGPYEVAKYDNMDRVTDRALFSMFLPGLDPRSNTNRGMYSRSFYSQRGMGYRQQVAIDPTQSSPTWLSTDQWYDSVGRTISTRSPNSPRSKRTYDALGRPKTVYITDGLNDAAPGEANSFVHAQSVSDDIVLEQTEYEYLSSFGSPGPDGFADRVSRVTSRYRNHDNTAAGALSGSGGSIATYAGFVYDAGLRQIGTVNFGTNATQDLFTAGPAPTWPPKNIPTYATEGYANTIISGVTYNNRGLVEDQIDPQGRKTRVLYDDLSRRIAVIENYEDATISYDVYGFWRAWNLDINEPDTDRVTSFIYDGVGHVIRQIAYLPDEIPEWSAVMQITEYVYGTSHWSSSWPLPDSRLASGNLLAAVRYPEDTVEYSYNRAGELVAIKDQNGTVHEYDRDNIGRVISDNVTTFGTNIDNRIKAIGVEYDQFGRIQNVSSYGAIGSNILNQVQFTYTPLWQIQSVTQDVDSEIGNSSGIVSQVVGYTYDNSAASNYSRLSAMIYPSGDYIVPTYGQPLNARISRSDGWDLMNNPLSIFPGSQLVRYDFVGLSMHSMVDYPEIDVQLDRTYDNGKRRTMGYTSQAEGVYPGWDRFGRVRRQAWMDGSLDVHAFNNSYPSKPPILDQAYTYDVSSNRLTKTDARPWSKTQGFDFKYEYDQLDRLKESLRGKGVPWTTTLTQSQGSQRWTLDMLGNWRKFETDLDDGGGGWGTYTDAGDEVQNRMHNMSNELGQIVTSDGWVTQPLAYDQAGNLRQQKVEPGATLDRLYTHDAWNRLVRVQTYDPAVQSVECTLAEYEYNGLHWRTMKRADRELRCLDPQQAEQQGIEHRAMYYDASWRLIEEHIKDRVGLTYPNGLRTRISQQFWGDRYIDDAVARRMKTYNAQNPNHQEFEPQNMWWYVTDAQFSVAALLDSAANLVERLVYDPYGKATHYRPADINYDGVVDNTDLTILYSSMVLKTKIYESGYNPDTDLMRSGIYDYLNKGWFENTQYYNMISNGGAVDEGEITETDPHATWPSGENSSAVAPDNPIGYCGYVYNPETQDYTVRFRHYSPRLGRWLERDPIQYVDGMNIYEAVSGNSITSIDSFGLHKQDNWYDIPSELKNNKDFRKFVECSKEGVELPKGFQLSRKELLELAEEWASTAKISKSVRDKIGRALRGMKGKLGGLALMSLSFYFFADDAAAAVTDEQAPCRKFLAAIKQNTDLDKCNESQLKDLGEECKWDLVERVSKAWGTAAGSRMEDVFDKFLADVIEACRNHQKDCSKDKEKDNPENKEKDNQEKNNSDKGSSQNCKLQSPD